MVWLPEGEKNEYIFIRFDRMFERDRHTGRQTDRHRMTAKAALQRLHSIAQQKKMVIKQQKLMLKTSMEV